jgi:CheY-like chemotaxis protein
MARIMVVEDDGALQLLIQRVLLGSGHSVRLVEDGAAALRQFREFSPDLVLLDMILPGRDGFEILEDMRKLDSEVYIVAMSGGGRLGPDVYLKMAQALGVRGILHKPFGPLELLQVVSIFKEFQEGLRAS